MSLVVSGFWPTSGDMFTARNDRGDHLLAFEYPGPGRHYCEACGARVILHNPGPSAHFAHLPGADPCPAPPCETRTTAKAVSQLAWRISKMGWSHAFNVRVAEGLVAPLIIDTTPAPVAAVVSDGALSQETFLEVTEAFNTAGYPVWWVFTKSVLVPAQEGASRTRLSGGVVLAQLAGYGLFSVVDEFSRLLVARVSPKSETAAKTLRDVSVYGPLSKKTLGESSRLWLATERRPLWVDGRQHTLDLVRLESTSPSIRRRITFGDLPLAWDEKGRAVRATFYRGGGGEE